MMIRQGARHLTRPQRLRPKVRAAPTTTGSGLHTSPSSRNPCHGSFGAATTAHTQAHRRTLPALRPPLVPILRTPPLRTLWFQGPERAPQRGPRRYAADRDLGGREVRSAAALPPLGTALLSARSLKLVVPVVGKYPAKS